VTAPDFQAITRKIMTEKGYTPPLKLQAASASPRPILPGPALVPTVIQQATQRQQPLPKGRLSRGPSDQAFGWFWNPEILDGQSRQDVIRQCRLACLVDSDAASAKRNLIALANPGYTLEFTGSDLAKRKGYAAIEDLGTHLGDFRGWDELINHQLGEAYEAGAGSLEAFPNLGRSGVAGVEVVPAEEVTILRYANERLYRQVLYGADLDPRTYIYAGYNIRGRDPHGTPVMVSALEDLARKATLILGTDKIVRLVSEGAFLHLGVPKPTLAELGVQTELDPDYSDRLTEFYTSYVTIATQARELGVMVTENGTDAKVVPLTGNVSGIADLQMMNSLRLWNGLMTQKFLQGATDGVTQALAEVVYPIQLSHAENMQIIARSVVEFVMNLHLRLIGVAASVEIDFLAPPNPFMEAHAKARREDAQTDAIYMEQLGPEYVAKVAARLDLDPNKVQKWRDENKPAPAPLALAGSETTGTNAAPPKGGGGGNA
jgi:hypothetical protein